MLTTSVRLHIPFAAPPGRAYFHVSKQVPAKRQRLRFPPCVIKACQPQLDFNNERRSDTCEPPPRQDLVTLKQAPRTNRRRIFKMALAWAMLVPLSFWVLSALTSAQPKRHATLVSAVTMCSTNQPTASTCAKMTHNHHVSRTYQGAFASISISSFEHVLRHLHTAHFAKLLTYQAQRVSVTVGLSEVPS